LPPPPPEPEDEPEGDSRALGDREGRSAQERYRIAKNYEKLTLTAADRIVKAEIRELKKGIAKYLPTRDITDFNTWLDEYYRTLPELIRKQSTPVYRSMMVDIKAAVANELGIDGEIAPEDEEFVGAFVTVFITRYINKSRSDISRTMTVAVDEGAEVDERLDALFTDWTQGRPGEIALNETVRGSNAFARNAMLLAGVSVLRWVALGPKSCPYCQSMNGRVVEITKSFMLPGDQVISDDNELNVKRVTGHPPLHRGCVCQVVAG